MPAQHHAVVPQVRLHCGVCGSPLLFPRKLEVRDKEGLIEDDKPVTHALAECNICAVAVQVPASVLQPLEAVHCVKTEARPWPKKPGA